MKKSEKDSLIPELKDKVAAALANNEELDKVVSKLKEKVVDLEWNMRNVRSRCFPLKTLPQMTHW